MTTGPTVRGGVALLGCILVSGLMVGVGSASGGAFPGTNGRIVYADGSIVTANPDGSHVVPLTSYAAGTYANEPRWSADGKRIVYQRTTGTSVSIDVMNADGSDQHALVSGSNATGGTFPENPSFSPDGTKILFDEVQEQSNAAVVLEGLYTMGSDGSNPTPLNVSGLTSNDAWEAQYSPDGSEIVFSGASFGKPGFQIGTVPAGGGPATFLTNTKDNQSPDFSPDGTRIVWSEPNASGVDASVEVMSSNGLSPTTLAAGSSTADNIQPVFSPDGTDVLFTNLAEGLFVVNAGGGTVTPLSTPCCGYQPDWGQAPLITAAPQPSAQVDATSIKGGSAYARLFCRAGPPCKILGTLTTVEHRVGSKVVSLTKNGRLALTKAKRKHRVTVTVASATLSISSDSGSSFTLKPNSLGKRLLKRFGKLPVELTVTLINATNLPVLAQLSGTLREPKKKKKR